jgi:hypothetical protein
VIFGFDQFKPCGSVKILTALLTFLNYLKMRHLFFF